MGGEIVTIAKRIEDVKETLEKYQEEFQKLLPRHITVQRFARVALNEVTRNPKLLNCSKASFYGSLLESAALGLEPGVAGQCWILPYKSEAKLILGYRGLVQLALRSTQVNALWAQVVRMKDEFEYTDYPQVMRHKRYIAPDMMEPEVNPLRAAYSVARMRDGFEQFLVLEAPEIDKIKKQSASAHKPESPWNTWPEEQWKKCPLKRQIKTLAVSFDVAPLHRAIELDDQAEAGLPQDTTLRVEEAGLSFGSKEWGEIPNDNQKEVPNGE